MSLYSDKEPDIKPPALANKVLSILLPNRLAESVLGDLEEEFNLLAKQNIKRANLWYWQQALETSRIYLQKKLVSVEMLGRLNFYLPLIMFIMTAGLIVLLSILSDPTSISDTFWDELLQGKIHTALFSTHFWHNFWDILALAEWGMFIHFESLLISFFSIAMLLYLYKEQQASITKLAVCGYSLAFIPYIWSIMHIANHSFEARQIGPIVATGILCLLYQLPPVSYIIHRKLMQLKAVHLEIHQ
ncbi:permease prefix domain 2-containing transporter [Pseudoalteromonas sp. OOF1S-7]|uniref:permease prefix domain 2-containing transporter n=1 Tax=Pseudoalteromonas sp. OOF1S-7 TaxID=2917757 RepID=UPI001EF3FB79|nr:permease prefix domain 2-containing transporter [Pseudoalteromonas sp. OOF1S-7]MCG7535786.1 permease prefix domain 2-containing transporter [Pseudoalteromonas sp. OOF1S-7]